jgi:hypothetical protein
MSDKTRSPKATLTVTDVDGSNVDVETTAFEGDVEASINRLKDSVVRGRVRAGSRADELADFLDSVPPRTIRSGVCGLATMVPPSADEPASTECESWLKEILLDLQRSSDSIEDMLSDIWVDNNAQKYRTWVQRVGEASFGEVLKEPYRAVGRLASLIISME